MAARPPLSPEEAHAEIESSMRKSAIAYAERARRYSQDVTDRVDRSRGEMDDLLAASRSRSASPSRRPQQQAGQALAGSAPSRDSVVGLPPPSFGASASAAASFRPSVVAPPLTTAAIIPTRRTKSLSAPRIEAPVVSVTSASYRDSAMSPPQGRPAFGSGPEASATISAPPNSASPSKGRGRSESRPGPRDAVAVPPLFQTTALSPASSPTRGAPQSGYSTTGQQSRDSTAAATPPLYSEGRTVSALRSDLRDLDRGVRTTADAYEDVDTPLMYATQKLNSFDTAQKRPGAQKTQASPGRSERNSRRYTDVPSFPSSFSYSRPSADTASNYSFQRTEVGSFDEQHPASRTSLGYQRFSKYAFLMAEDGVPVVVDLERGAPPLAANQQNNLAQNGSVLSGQGRGHNSGELKESHNVLLLFRLQTLRALSGANFVLAVLCLSYVGLNIVMVALNHYNRNDAGPPCHDPESVFVARCGSPTSIWTFHIVEFTSTFAFSVVQASALLFTPRSAASIYDDPGTLRLVLFFAVVVSLVPTLLIWFNIEAFEVPAHEIEYANEVTMSFIDIVLFSSLVRTQAKKAKAESDDVDSSEVSEDERRADRHAVKAFKAGKRALVAAGREASQGKTSVTMGYVACGVAVVQLMVYNGMGVSADGERLGEKPAHYLEFVFEIISAFITFWFCVDSKCSADREIEGTMFQGQQDLAEEIADDV